MKTAMDMLDRLEALARRIADDANRAYDLKWVEEEARAIVAELPPVVDPLEAQAQRYYDDWVSEPSGMPFAVDAMAYALRRAREEGVK